MNTRRLLSTLTAAVLLVFGSALLPACSDTLVDDGPEMSVETTEMMSGKQIERYFLPPPPPPPTGRCLSRPATISTRHVMRKVHIIREIDVTVFKRRGPITRWNIGITENPESTRQALSENGFDLSSWHHWTADTSMDASAIGELFTMLGMQPAGVEATTEEAATVFVF